MRFRKGGDTINNYKNELQPIYNTSATIGIVYSLISTILGTIFCTLVIIAGVWIKNMNSDKTAYTLGYVTDVSDCNFKEKKCVSTIDFNVKHEKYTVKSVTGIGNKGQNIGIYYNPENPNNFTTNNYSTIIGWVMIAIGIFIIISLWLWFILTLIFKPIAAATGVGAVADTAIPNL